MAPVHSRHPLERGWVSTFAQKRRWRFSVSPMAAFGLWLVFEPFPMLAPCPGRPDAPERQPGRLAGGNEARWGAGMGCCWIPGAPPLHPGAEAPHRVVSVTGFAFDDAQVWSH